MAARSTGDANVAPLGTTGADADELQKFGYKPEFERSIPRFASFAIAFSFISITTGIFTTYGAVLASSGPLGIWTWPIVIAGQLCVSLIFASFAARVPVTGYSYQWTSRLGNPTIGWLIGWISFTFLVIDVVAVDYAVASTVLPALFNYAGTTNNSWVLTALVVLAQGSLIMLSTKWSARTNSIAVGTELIGMIGLVVLVLVVGAIGGHIDFGNLFSKGTVPSDGYWSFGSGSHAGPWILGFLLGSFTIVGFEAAANLAEETSDPHTVVPRSMWQAVALSGVVGFLFLVTITLAAGNITDLTNSGTPVADIIDNILGGFVGTLFLILVSVSIFACGLVIFITAVRLTWAMSRDQRFPGWSLWHKVNPSRGTPMLATLLIGVVCEIVLAIFANRQDALFKLFSAATLLPAIIYFATVILYIVRRKRLPAEQGRFHLGRFEKPVIVVALVWLLFELSIFRDSSFKDPWIYAGVMLAVGLVYLIGLLGARRGQGGLGAPGASSPDAELEIGRRPL